ncbi:hypothetical protein [Paraglaciecola sp. L3A3]|uniref:hypothetical protein n=1 Tax=Paraglaciecola sp. L3A3 TaxID=2686358 RepID=UPI00131E7304|nr:hypothetical protein [Paraglaciecola sp. L3A3]
MADKEEEKKGWNNIAASISEAVGDLATLSVETYTGDLEVVVGTDNKLKWDSMLATVRSSEEKVKGKLKLALATQIKIDGDSVNFISENNVSETLIQTHASAVKNGSEFRSKVIGLALGKLTS